MAGKEFYFSKFDDRLPYKAIPDNKFRTWLFQFSGIVTIALGIAYLNWRWRYSFNYDVLWFSLLLVIAETLSFVSTILLVFNFWANKDPEKTPPVHFLSEIEDLEGRPDRPIKIDIFIATYNEEVELVRLSIIDAKKIKYPYPDVEVKIYVLDDGRRDGRNPAKENMKKVAEEEGVNYLIREHNEGYKAGNLKNALEHTDGDLFAILDADTRAFPDFLNNTTGYFKRKKVAWVQTPQWFYDTTEAEKLSDVIISNLNIKNKPISRFLDFAFGKIMVNEDIYGNDPRLFYDAILRKRNFHNAAFCCGAASVHRREAIMSLAVKDFSEEILKLEEDLKSQHKSKKEIKQQTDQLILNQDVIPFKFHASEDIYTSIMLHADRENRWESIQHADIECKMLSTQDLDSWIKQHKRYAEGSLDIALKDNPVFKNGLTFSQKICYFNTIWSYFAPLWILIFLISPIIFFFTLNLPVRAYSFDFFKHFLPFQFMNTLTITLGCWGISTKRGDQYYISSFWFMLMSLISVIRGKKVEFNVTRKDLQFSNNNLKHVIPHMVIIALIFLGIFYNIILILTDHHPSPSGFAANAFWCIFNIISLSIMIRAAFWKPLNKPATEQL
ncbi:MAG: cellulose synthase [Bacteroidota bacterium]|jgi:cellulose synthase (UDP-forming)|nr:cellulose synthase [Bacteroidota bacterium]